MDIVTLLGILAIVLGILALMAVVPGGIVAAIVLIVLGLILLGGGLSAGRRRL